MVEREKKLRSEIREAYLSDLQKRAASRLVSKGLVSSNKKIFFIGKQENKIRTLGGAEYVRGYSRAGRR